MYTVIFFGGINLKRFFSFIVILLVITTLTFAGYRIYRAKNPTPGTDLPILFFHHLAEEVNDNNAIVTPEYFETVLQTLKENNFNTITPQQLADYVYKGEELPENPVMIQFDDGYESNVLIAAPLLRKYDMCATVFAITQWVTYSSDEDFRHPESPLFTWEQAREVLDVMSIQSHSNNMHYNDDKNPRKGVLQKEDESDSDYQKAFVKDYKSSKKKIKKKLSTKVFAYAYPFGMYTKETERMLKEQGVLMTFVPMKGEGNVSRIVPDEPESLYLIQRKSISVHVTMKEILKYLSR
jgi:Predicted xylanase/chitin deacetylase